MNKGRIVFSDDDEFTFDTDLYEVSMTTNRDWIYVKAKFFLTEEEKKRLQMSCYAFPAGRVVSMEY